MKEGESGFEERLWKHIEIRMNYGYGADFPNSIITCFSDGMLEFKTGKAYFDPDLSWIEDRSHEISKKTLIKLDEVVKKVLELKRPELVGYMCDGPSFDCLVFHSDGSVQGFHYCSAIPSDEIRDLECLVRKLLREDFFLRKHRRSEEDL
jgi:hypothetical protein